MIIKYLQSSKLLIEKKGGRYEKEFSLFYFVDYYWNINDSICRQ
jgi:hypothetical protein